MLDIVQLPLGAYQTNCYLVAREGASEAVVIDPGDEPGAVLEVLGERGWTAVAVLVTHGHHDHLGAVKGVAEASGIEVWMPRDEADDLRVLDGAAHEPDHLLDGGETVSVAGMAFDTMPVPGHSRASIAYHADGHLFSGDVLFAGSVGRTDFAGGDMVTLVRSIGRLMEAYPADTVVLPGHGPATTLGRELAGNPFLGALRA
jgi:hydroxyacylglutathione hydrolase